MDLDQRKCGLHLKLADIEVSTEVKHASQNKEQRQREREKKRKRKEETLVVIPTTQIQTPGAVGTSF